MSQRRPMRLFAGSGLRAFFVFLSPFVLKRFILTANSLGKSSVCFPRVRKNSSFWTPLSDGWLTGRLVSRKPVEVELERGNRVPLVPGSRPLSPDPARFAHVLFFLPGLYQIDSFWMRIP
jgi:hypothetical protein